MANLKDIKEVAPVTIFLGGRERVVKYDLNAFAELENTYGTVDAAMAKLSDGKLKDLRNILWAGLIHEEAEFDEITGEPTKYNITPYQVGSWVASPAEMQAVGESVGRAMSAGMPSPENLTKPDTSAPTAPATADGVEGASVVLTEEEKQAAETEAKNG